MGLIGPRSNIQLLVASLDSLSSAIEGELGPGSQLIAGKGCVTSKNRPLIAIVDDDESVCRAIKRLVRSLGMNAETFASGQDFIDVVEATPSFYADCVVLDVQMPGLNGLEVQERMVRCGSRLPIIFITAHDENGVRERALAMGAIAFLRKPFQDQLLIDTLRIALEPSADRKQEV